MNDPVDSSEKRIESVLNNFEEQIDRHRSNVAQAELSADRLMGAAPKEASGETHEYGDDHLSRLEQNLHAFQNLNDYMEIVNSRLNSSI